MHKVLIFLTIVLSLSCSSVQKVGHVNELAYSKKSGFKIKNFKLDDFWQKQSLKIKFKAKNYSGLGVLKSKQGQIKLVALTGMGVTLFNLNYTNKKLDFKASPILPKGFDPKLILFDLIVIYGKVEALKESSYGNIQIKDAALQRNISIDGIGEYLVTYSNKNKIKSKLISVEHLTRNYKFEIKVLEGSLE